MFKKHKKLEKLLEGQNKSDSKSSEIVYRAAVHVASNAGAGLDNPAFNYNKYITALSLLAIASNFEGTKLTRLVNAARKLIS